MGLALELFSLLFPFFFFPLPLLCLRLKDLGRDQFRGVKDIVDALIDKM